MNINIISRLWRAAAMSMALVASAACISCDDDHEPDWTETAPVDFAMVSSSIADNSVVDVQTYLASFTYDAPIVINPSVDITLNGEPLMTELLDEKTLQVRFSLRAGRSYTLEIPTRAIAGVGTKTFAPGVTVKFSTPAIATNFGPLCNPSATPQAKNVYDFLVQNHGVKILSGAMANVNNNNDFAGWIKKVSGKDVAITGYDFIHLPESGQSWIDYSDITPAKTQWENNGLVSYMWHWRVPDSEQAWRDGDFSKYGARTPADDVEDPTSFDIREALKVGTWQHDFIIADIDKVAEHLKLLQEAGIPVIWRPLHEAAGSYKYNNAWFWWGRYGDQYTKELWVMMYNRLVNLHGLNNLIWVWTAQYEEGYTDQMNASYPGNNYVDIVGTDIYADNDDAQYDAYEALLDMTQGTKLVTISETGRIQNPDKCIADGADWSWFMLWYTYDQHLNGGDTDGFGNTTASIKAVLESPYVINRDDMPSLK